MVGGGPGAVIGPVHRMAAALDGQFELVAGAFASDPARSHEFGLSLGLAPDRCYATYADMHAAESARPDGIEVVSIVTPNATHFDIAKLFLEGGGVDVICDKPVTATLSQAQDLAVLLAQSGRCFVVTQNYSGYPMVREARARIAAGELGPLRVIQVEYAQGWLAESVENAGSKQAAWRTDPALAGAGGALGDIGTHAYNLADFVGGIALSELAAELTAFGEGRQLDDNVQVMLRYANGARGALWASQVAPGNENGLRLRIYGTKGGLVWVQANPNEMLWSPLGQSTRIVTRGGPDSGEAAARVTRIPPGHPEGYLEGFANVYSEVALAIKAARSGKKPPEGVHFPTIEDGVKGLAFVEAAVKSSKANGAWVKL